MVRTRAMRTWAGLGLHALGVAIFALSLTTPVGYSDALHIRRAIGSSHRRPPAELPHHAAFSNSREPRLTAQASHPTASHN